MASKAPALLRGPDLVDDVIAKVKLEGKGKKQGWVCGPCHQAPPRPVSAKALAKLKFSNGKPLPESLKRWLAFDGALLDVEPNASVIEVTTFREACESFEVVVDWAVEELGDTYSELVWVLPGGGDSVRLLYIGKQDKQGEYPALYVDFDDTPMVAVGVLMR